MSNRKLHKHFLRWLYLALFLQSLILVVSAETIQLCVLWGSPPYSVCTPANTEINIKTVNEPNPIPVGRTIYAQFPDPTNPQSYRIADKVVAWIRAWDFGDCEPESQVKKIVYNQKSSYG